MQNTLLVHFSCAFSVLKLLLGSNFIPDHQKKTDCTDVPRGTSLMCPSNKYEIKTKGEFTSLPRPSLLS